MTIRHLLFCVLVFFLLSPLEIFSQNYTLINDATVYSGCNCYRLTPDLNNQGGGVYQNNTINLNNSFDYTFNVFLGCNSGGADGIVFILTNNITGIGASGGGLGYAGLPGNSFAAEYDTYQNSQDPSYDHIALESGGSVNHNVAGPVQASSSATNIKDCAWHTTEIIWNVNTQTYSVYFDGVLRITYTGNIVANFFGGNPIVNWGWSGSTGGSTDDQRFCVTTISSWVAGTNYQSCSNSVQFHDVSTSNVGSVQGWAWDFGDPGSGTSDTSSQQNPTHTYSGTGTHSVTLTITDITGCTTTYSHNVLVNPPITMSPTLTSPPCNGGTNGSISVSSTGGFGVAAGYGGYSYTWSNGSTGSTDLGLTAGTYNVTVSDGVCSATASYSLTQPSPLTAVTSHTDAPCGGNTGSVTMTISGGTPPYSGVNWNLVPGYTLNNIPPNTYVADFHDANGCSALLQYSEVVNSLPCGYSLSATSTDVTCFNGSNGTATLTVTGGTNPITISWTNSSGTTVSNVANATGLVADTYTYNYSDGAGHAFTGTVIVHQPGAAIVAGLTTTATTCSYLNDGSAVASVTANGTPPYNYTWSVAQPNSPTATGLSPGGISVSITDSHLCTAVASGNISGQTLLSPSVSVTDARCYLDNNGSATVSVTGGTPVYSYLWNNNGIGSTNYGIAAGTYTVTVTDQNSCTATASGTVGQPAVFTVGQAHVNVLCFGNSTGTITLTQSGGTTPYAAPQWLDGTTGATRSSLPAGTYYFADSDTHGCLFIDSIKILQPASAFNVSETHVNVKCKGTATGSITLTLSGGTTPYGTVNWGGGVTGANRNNLIAGNYTYTVSDANGCTATSTINIAEPTTAFMVGQAHVDVLCFGNNTGTITLTQSGGTTPYAAPQWLDLAVGTTRSNLVAGTYYYADSDANGCLFIDSVKVLQPAAAFTVSQAHVDVLCFGSSTGTITLTQAGGTTPYAAPQWLDGATGTTRSNLPAGTYYYADSDAHGCLFIDSVKVLQPVAVFAVTPSQVNVKCKGAPTGSITLTLSGGTTPYGTVNWAGGATGAIRTNLIAGNYTYTVSDANGCSVTNTINITEPAVAFTVGQAHVNVLCFGNNTGSITLTQSGGTTPYAAPQWLDLATGITRSNLVAGTYYYADSDVNGCLFIDSVKVLQPAAAFTVSQAHVDVLCFGNSTGTITLTQAGGTTPYALPQWLDGAIGTTRSNLPAGKFYFADSDSHGCLVIDSVIISQPTAFTVSETQVDVKCKGAPTGSITLTLSGGTTPYGTVDWGGGVTGTNLTNLIAGSYTYNVSDANNCPATAAIAITEPAAAFTVAQAHVDVLCFGNNTGSITLTQSGGTPPYAAPQWLDLATGTTRSNLVAGTYYYADSDANGCLFIDSVKILQPAQLAVGLTKTDATCSYSADGSAVATGAGGVSLYNFAWSNAFTETGVATSAATGLAANTYTVTITDQNNCTASGGITVGSPPRLTAQITVTDVDCFGNSTGAVSVTAGGGTSGFHYTWSANAATGDQPTASNLPAALYSLTITDASNCVLDTFATVAQPVSTLSYSTPVYVQNVSCNGGNNGEIKYAVGGGTPNYTFLWSGGAAGSNDSAVNLIAGSYDVTITDSKGCNVTNTVAVTEPTALSIVSQSQVDEICHGGNTGSATVNVTGGIPGAGYIYTWTRNAGNTSTVSALTAGPYTVVITDNNQCTISANFNIVEPSQIVALPSVANALCHGGATGTVAISASGGTPAVTGYTYTWSPNVSSTDSGLALLAGPYVVTVTDSLGCTAIANAQVGEPAALVPSITSVVNITCYGDSNGTVQLSAGGGTSPYQYAISPDGVNFSGANSSGFFANLKPITYTGQVTDAHGCVNTIPVTLTAPDSVIVTIVIDTVKCYGESNGVITANASGGTPGYTFNFSNGVTNTTGIDQSLSAGTYQFTVTDSKGCAKQFSAIMEQPDSITISVTPPNPTIDLAESVNLLATSNATDANFNWSPPDGLNTATGSAVTATSNYTTQYTITASNNPHGKECKVTTQILVTVVPNYNIYVPNAFTPNNDGINDYFEVFGNKKAIQYIDIAIFDRWGEVVFRSNDLDFKWDGSYKGTMLEPGTFVYTMSVVFIDDHSNSGYKGSLLLLR